MKHPYGVIIFLRVKNTEKNTYMLVLEFVFFFKGKKKFQYVSLIFHNVKI